MIASVTTCSTTSTRSARNWNTADATDQPDSDDDSDTETTAPTPKGLGDKRIRKLLDPQPWRHDGDLYKAADILRQEIGESLFEDYNASGD